jgi:hypothetical protein
MRGLDNRPQLRYTTGVKVGAVKGGTHTPIRDHFRKGPNPKGGGRKPIQNKPSAFNLETHKEVKKENGKTLVEVL